MIGLNPVMCVSIIAAVWLPLASPPAGAETESERLNAFFQEVHEVSVARWLEWQTYLRLKTNYALWHSSR